jgi:hypothetical protein
MAVPVYGWPPVGTVVRLWDVSEPISESLSGISGARYVSAIEPTRHIATARVSSLGKDRNGAGYVHALKRLLKGGVNLVRLQSSPINWYLDDAAEAGFRQSDLLTWESEGTPLLWTSGGSPMVWLTGVPLVATLTTSGGFPALSITGLPPNRLVCRPAEYLTVFEEVDDVAGVSVQAIAPATSNASGVAIVRLLEAAPFGGRVSIGVSISAVFKVSGGMPRSAQPIGADWFHDFEFEEVFADEVGGFTEVPDWYQPT